MLTSESPVTLNSQPAALSENENNNLNSNENQEKNDVNGQIHNDVEDELEISISNVVCNFSVKCHLNLRQIATQGANVVYKRDQNVSSLLMQTLEDVFVPKKEQN